MRILHYTFKAFAVLRLLCIPLIFILERWWHNSIPDTGAFDGLFKDGLDIDLPWWIYPLGISILISFSINTLVGLTLSFKPSVLFTRFFRNKLFLRIFYIMELILVPVYAYLLIQRIDDEFSSEDYGLIGNVLASVLSTVFPKNEKIEFIETLQVVNNGVLFVCILVFVLLFWRVYRVRRAYGNTDDTD